MKIINSILNTKIKKILKLKKKNKLRICKNIFFIEKIKEIQMAIKGGYKLKEILICKEKLIIKKFFIPKKTKKIQLGIKVFKKIACKNNNEGIIAICKTNKYINIENFNIRKKSLIIILDNIEKPGNLGAIIRTVNASNIDCVILNNNKIDIFNHNVIRCSMGTVFTTKIINSSNEKIFKWLKKNKINTLTTYINIKSKSIYNEKLKLPLAIIMGNENKGVSQFWIKKSEKKIQIPLYGKIDSLNLSAATAIIIFEIIRQNIKKNYI